jgi:cysteinyl-tRNA synthetase
MSRKKEEVRPIETGKIRLYTCGPTVYDFAHVGNLRTYIFEDVLRRTLEMSGFKVSQVMNITDIDDKTIKASGGKKAKFSEITREFEEAFFCDLKKLNIKKADTITRATEYVEKMVEFISDLMDKGYAYKGEDGSIYFSIDKFKSYGKLAHIERDELKVGARVVQDEYSKENPADFALWKAWDENDGEMFWDPATRRLDGLGVGTKLGKGRPGWHIECSTMSQDRLGETLDIHTGGVDNIFPHHENEIAQSEARTGKKFVNLWVHGEHLLVDGHKMAKSAGNFYKLIDIETNGFSPLDFRYLCLQSHYRSKLNFTWEALGAAKNARLRLTAKIQDTRRKGQGKSNIKNQISKYWDKFVNKISDDLNTPEALAVVWEMMRDEKASNDEKLMIYKQMDQVLALYEDIIQDEIPEEIKKLAQEREEARAEKDYKRADEIRKEIEDKGYRIQDKEGKYQIIQSK